MTFLKVLPDKVSQNYVFLAFLPYVRLKSQSYKSDTIWKRHCYLCRDATKFLGPNFNLNLNILLIKHHQNSLRSLCMMFNSSKYSNSRWILALTKISSCPNINSNVVSDSIGLILNVLRKEDKNSSWEQAQKMNQMFKVREYMTKNGMCYDLSGAVHRGESSHLQRLHCLHRTEKARRCCGNPMH